MSKIHYFIFFTIKDDVIDDVNHLHVGDINWWMICHLMMWIASM
jgi:hypothetical protein